LQGGGNAWLVASLLYHLNREEGDRILQRRQVASHCNSIFFPYYHISVLKWNLNYPSTFPLAII